MKNYLPFDEARAIADELLTLLRPACERIEVAGSLRRRRAEVGDLELVAISLPKRPTFGEKFSEGWQLFDAINAPDDRFTGSTLAGQRHRQFQFRGFPVDLYVVTPETWGVIFTLRTGNAMFSHWVVSQRRIHGGLPDHFCVRDGRVLDQAAQLTLITPEEANFLRLLGLPADLPPDHPIRNHQDWVGINRIANLLRQEEAH